MNGVLAIDTASSGVIAIAWLHGGAVEVRSWPGTQDHSRQLITAIDELLAGGTLPAAIAVTVGPGSYAGLRCGIATAESLALGWGVPVYGVGTLAAASRAAGNAGRLMAIHPAGRGDFACQHFRDGRPDGQPFLAPGDQVPGKAVVGEGAASLGGTEVAAEQRVAAVATLAEERIAAGERPQGLEAFYLREPNITRPKRTPLAPGFNTATAGRR